MAEFRVHDTKEAQSWLDTQSETVVVYLCVPTSTGTLTIADERAEPFSDEQQALLQTLVPALEMLVIRHRDLAAYAVVNEAYLQTRSRLINSNPDLMALQDGSFDLSAESVDEVAGLDSGLGGDHGDSRAHQTRADDSDLGRLSLFDAFGSALEPVTTSS